MGRISRFVNRNRGSLFRKAQSEILGRLCKVGIMRVFVSATIPNDKRPRSYIFILGNYNSGTTLLRELIGEHHEIDALPFEGVTLTDQWAFPEQLGWQRNWVYCLDHLRSTIADEKKMFHDIIRDWSPFYKRDNILLEKSISNIERIPLILRNFDDVKFVVIMRNPYASCEGMHRKSGPFGNALNLYGQSTYKWTDVAKQWLLANERIVEHLSDSTACTVIRYERLTENPKESLAEVFSFLNLEADKVFDFKGNEIHCASGRKFTLGNRNVQSFNRLSKEAIRQINYVIGENLWNFGYDLRE